MKIFNCKITGEKTKKIIDFGNKAKKWVYNNHDISKVSKKLYDYYQTSTLSKY